MKLMGVAFFAVISLVFAYTTVDNVAERPEGVKIGACFIAAIVLVSALLYAPGVILFALAKREQGQPLFTHMEKGIFSCVVAGAGVAAYGLYSGVLSL